MTAPEADRPPEGGSPEALAAGQRMLAAIVFTDTVGFSALMSKQEERTLQLVSRDLEHMKAVCAAFGGQVLKSTGDGLLMLFTSAVQAVACALEIQRDIQKLNLELPKEDRLQHRIGIHLGDVFQTAVDVMGDGVNIAARLQTEAVPGGICLSKTVYDVVQNRLPFYVNDLGARKLKNIGMVTAYQISPLENGPGPRRFGLPWYHWRGLIWRGVAMLMTVVTIILVFAAGFQYRHWVYARSHPTAMRPPSAAPTNAAAVHPSAPVVIPAKPAAPTPVVEVSDTEFQETSFRFMTRYDFEGMEAWMRVHNWPGKSTALLPKICPQMEHLFTWCETQMQGYSFANPLKIDSRTRTFYYWPAPFGGVGMRSTVHGVPVDETVKPVLLSREQIKPGTMVGIAHALMLASKEDEAEKNQLRQEIRTFMQIYNVAPVTPKPGQGAQPPTAPEPAEVTPHA